MKIHIENLPATATDDDLRELFSTFGKVNSASISGRAKSNAIEHSGIVHMDRWQGLRAIDHLRGFTFASRTIRVRELSASFKNVGLVVPLFPYT